MVSAAEAAARLKGAAWLKREETQAILSLLDAGSGRTRAVGGIVRDTLVGSPRETADVDLATELLPDEVMRRARGAGLGAYPTGIEHGTVTLKLGSLIAEVTTLREDIETDGRHALVRFGIDWGRDAERRDFTINALYADADGTLFDPLDGLADCLAGRVRFIGDPDQRIAEDRLRVYRFFRFSASHGGQKFDRDGQAACKRAAALLGGLAAERVGAEMKRMLALPKVSAALRIMAEDGIAALPTQALRALQSYERRARRPDFGARLALIAMFVDGKLLQARWRLSNDDLAAAEAILNSARLLQHLKINEAAYRYPAVLVDGIDVAGVLEGWTHAAKAAILEQVQGVKVPRFPISGGDLIHLGMKPGSGAGRRARTPRSKVGREQLHPRPRYAAG